MGAYFPTDPETILPEFASSNTLVTDPTSGKLNVIEPAAEQKLNGWVPFRKRPERSVLNWLHRYTYKGLKYWKDTFFPAVDAGMKDHDNKIINNTYGLTNMENFYSQIQINETYMKCFYRVIAYNNSGLSKIASSNSTNAINLVTDGALDNVSDGGVIDNNITELAPPPITKTDGSITTNLASCIAIYAYCTVDSVGAVVNNGVWIGTNKTSLRTQIAAKYSIITDKIYISKIPIGVIWGSYFASLHKFVPCTINNGDISFSGVECSNISTGGTNAIPRNVLYSSGSGNIEFYGLPDTLMSAQNPGSGISVIDAISDSVINVLEVSLVITGVRIYASALTIKESIGFFTGGNTSYIDLSGNVNTFYRNITFKLGGQSPFGNISNGFSIWPNFQTATPPANSTVIYRIDNIKLNNVKYISSYSA